MLACLIEAFNYLGLSSSGASLGSRVQCLPHKALYSPMSSTSAKTRANSILPPYASLEQSMIYKYTLANSKQHISSYITSSKTSIMESDGQPKQEDLTTYTLSEALAQQVPKQEWIQGA